MKNNVCLVTGSEGFIGSALVKKLEEKGNKVIAFEGLTHYPQDWSKYLDYDIDYVFHFGSPSSQILFDRDEGCITETIQGFMQAAFVAMVNNARLVYPSSGAVNANPLGSYGASKLALEAIHQAYKPAGLNAIGLRIFAGYGPGEAHKKDYASVAYQFTKTMYEGERPIIYGNGSQTRDFIYIDDIVEAIIRMAQDETRDVVDVASGLPISFRALIDIINRCLGSDIQPKYTEKPGWYMQNTLGNPQPLLQHGLFPYTSLEEGISYIIQELENDTSL